MSCRNDDTSRPPGDVARQLVDDELKFSAFGLAHPALPPPAEHGISAATSRDYAERDPYLTPRGRSTLLSAIPPGGGLVPPNVVARSLVGAGVGYAASTVAGGTLGLLFGMPMDTRRRLQRVGAIAGALYNSGLLGR